LWNYYENDVSLHHGIWMNGYITSVRISAHVCQLTKGNYRYETRKNELCEIACSHDGQLIFVRNFNEMYCTRSIYFMPKFDSGRITNTNTHDYYQDKTSCLIL